MTPATRFTHLLEDLGIPIHGVSGNDPGARIDFNGATPEQEAAARAAAQTFDWSEKEPRTEEQIEADLLRLTSQQRQLVLDKMIAEFLTRRPKVAAAVEIPTEARI